LAIIQGREGHEFWKNPPAIIHRKMYIWHCTNPIEVQNGGIPELIERGPYVYQYSLYLFILKSTETFF
jgi:hypothetical protein